MSDNLKKCIEELKLVMKIKDKTKRNIILEYLSQKDEIYNALREIAVNIMKKNIKLNKNQLKRLGRHGNTIIDLNDGVKRKQRKRIVQQSGGFLPWLLPVVATVLGSIIK